MQIDLRGGRPAMVVPTATVILGADSPGDSCQLLISRVTGHLKPLCLGLAKRLTSAANR
jgi:hypothetical protein